MFRMLAVKLSTPLGRCTDAWNADHGNVASQLAQVPRSRSSASHAAKRSLTEAAGTCSLGSMARSAEALMSAYHVRIVAQLLSQLSECDRRRLKKERARGYAAGPASGGPRTPVYAI